MASFERLFGAVLVAVVVVFTSHTSARNLDLRNPMVFQAGSAPERDFGYAVSFHVHHGMSSVLVGAPRDTSNMMPAGINETGAVYRCQFDFNSNCAQLNLDTADNNGAEEKSYMRMGTTLMSSGTNGVVVACSPYYHNTYDIPPGGALSGLGLTTLWDPVGRCHIIPSTLNASIAEPFQPCNSFISDTGFDPNTGSMDICLTGATMDIADTFVNLQNHSSLLLGAPTYRYGTGRMFVAAINISGATFSAIDQNTPLTLPPYVYLSNEANWDTSETQFRRLSYTGLSSTQGDFNSDGLHEVAFSKPEANMTFSGEPWTRLPLVFITPSTGDSMMTQNSRYYTDFLANTPEGIGILEYISGNGAGLQPHSYIRILGQQRHELFGKVMIAYDTNDDGRDELIIGAPMYSQGLEEQSLEDRNGRVYVYSASLTTACNAVFVAQTNMSYEIAKPDKVLQTGINEAQFGQALARLGDIDHDGYNDVAVGAPFEEGHGSVYIFYGSETGLSSVQRLRPSTLGLSGLMGFGFSLSPGMDADGNTYNDLLIGAPLSNHAVVLRSRATLDLSVSFNLNNDIDFTAMNCQSDFPSFKCFTIQVCLNASSDVSLAAPVTVKYTISAGRNLIFQPGLAVAAALNLTGIMINGQVRRPGEGGVGASGNRTEMTLDAQIVISALSTVCINHTVYLRPVLTRPCRPSRVSLSWNTAVTDSTRTALSHIVKEATQQPIAGNVNFVPNCAVCVPDLAISNVVAVGGLSGQEVDTILAGSGSPTQLQFTFSNKGSVAACRPEIRIAIPSKISLLLLTPAVLSCVPPLNNTAHFCVPRRTLFPGEQFTAKFRLDGANLKNSPSFHLIDFAISSNNTNPEVATLSDNVHQKRLNVKSQASLTTVGTAIPSSINVITTSADTLLSRVIHRHSVLNQGPSSSPPSTVEIRVELGLPGGFLYASLENVLSTSAATRCNYTDEVDSIVPTQPANATLLYQVARPGWQPQSLGGTNNCGANCVMVCNIPELTRGDSVRIELWFDLRTGALRMGGYLSSGLTFESTSRVLSVDPAEGFTWNRNGSLQSSNSTTQVNLVVGGVDSSIPWLLIWLPIVGVLLLILLVLLILKSQGFFDRGKHLEQLMLQSTQAVLGPAKISTDGIYRKNVPAHTTEGTDGGRQRKPSRPSLTRQESSI